MNKNATIFEIHLNTAIHWKALAEYSQMSTHVIGFPFAPFLWAKLDTSSIRDIVLMIEGVMFFK